MKQYVFYVCGFLFLSACTTTYQQVQNRWELIPVRDTLHDKKVHEMIQPYKASLDSLMHEAVSYTENDLTRAQPEGSLGDFVCDELLEYIHKDSAHKVDFCMLNNGGLRIPAIPKGTISLEQVYELLPFENTLEILEVDGATCKQLLNGAASQGGVPVGGVRFNIASDSAFNIIIHGENFDPGKNYFILTNDYLANGGEEIMLKAIKRYSLTVKLRDAVIIQLREKKAHNQTIKTVKDGRIAKI